MNAHQLGIVLIAVGAGVVLLGFAVLSGAMHWFGRLPDDIRVQREGFRLYAPLVSMLLISVIASFVLWIIRRLGK